jgi:hypothetical protein
MLILFTSLYVVSLFATLSRGAIVAFGLQIIAGIVLLWDIGWAKKLLYSIFVVLASGWLLYLINGWKSGSNVEHGNAFDTAIEVIQDNPLGYGMGMAGPAQHYAPDYQMRPKHDLSLVESLYVQRLVNLGWPWLALILALLGMWLWLGVQLFMHQRDDMLYMIAVLMSMGLGALLVEWLVLHTLIDSMVNYLFLVPYGMTVGYIHRRIRKDKEG